MLSRTSSERPPDRCLQRAPRRVEEARADGHTTIVVMSCFWDTNARTPLRGRSCDGGLQLALANTLYKKYLRDAVEIGNVPTRLTSPCKAKAFDLRSLCSSNALLKSCQYTCTIAA